MPLPYPAALLGHELAHVQGRHSLRAMTRSLEQEADEAGLELLRQNQLNPQGMVWLLERMQASDDPEMLAYLSTHPNTDDRIREVKRQMNKCRYKTAPNTALEAAWEKLKQ